MGKRIGFWFGMIIKVISDYEYGIMNSLINMKLVHSLLIFLLCTYEVDIDGSSKH